MKKAIACFLALVMILTLPYEAGADGLWEWFFSSSSSGATLCFVPVSDAAFSRDDVRLIGADGDGRMLLMMNTFELYLWDLTANRRVPISFVREEDAAVLSEACVNVVLKETGRNLKGDERTALQQELAEKQAAWLSTRGQTAFTDMDQIAACYPYLVSLGSQVLGTSDRWALVALNNLSVTLMLEFSTGKALLVPGIEGPMDICGSRVLLRDGTIFDAATGEHLQPNLMMPTADDGRPDTLSYAQAVVLCADGTEMALLRDGPLSPEGNDYWLVEVSADTNIAQKIGYFARRVTPNRLLTAGDDRFLLFTSYNSATAKHVLLDRETRTITALETDRYLPVAGTESGFLCLRLSDYTPIILDAATGGAEKELSLAGGFDWSILNAVMMGSIVQGTENRYFCTTSNTLNRRCVRGFFVLEGE